MTYCNHDIIYLTKYCLPSDIWLKIQALNINSVKPTRRGTKGKKKKGTILQQLNENYSSLKYSPPVVSTSSDQTQKDSKINFCCLNMQSIRNKTDEFNAYVLQHNFHLVAITETWLKPGDDFIERELTPQGYTFCHVRRQVKKRGGGVGLLYKSTLSVKIKDNHNDYQTFESLHAEISCNSKSLRLIVIYRPELDSTGHRVKFSLFLQEFETLVSYYLIHPSEILLTGDFNIHFNTSGNESIRFKELLSSHTLIQHVNEPTHRSGNCIDFIITRDFPIPFV